MRALKIGMVDLDTSHPQNWIPIIRSLGHEVVGVYDGGAIYPEGYAALFAEKHQVANVYTDLNEMAADVDAAFIHSCNWDVHIERARPFIEAGKAVFVDKPMAGSMKDVEQLLKWRSEGALIAGGSALMFCSEVQQWRSTHRKEEALMAVAGCSVDEFNYGIHAYSMLLGLLGPGVESVRFLGENIQRHIEICWSDGRRGIVAVGETEGYLPFYATVVTERDVSHLQADIAGLYQALLEEVLPYLAGDRESSTLFERMIEAEQTAIAAQRSRSLQGARVYLKDLPGDDIGYDGASFNAAYKKMKLG